MDGGWEEEEAVLEKHEGLRHIGQGGGQGISETRRLKLCSSSGFQDLIITYSC